MKLVKFLLIIALVTLGETRITRSKHKVRSDPLKEFGTHEIKMIFDEKEYKGTISLATSEHREQGKFYGFRVELITHANNPDLETLQKYAFNHVVVSSLTFPIFACSEIQKSTNKYHISSTSFKMIVKDNSNKDTKIKFKVKDWKPEFLEDFKQIHTSIEENLTKAVDDIKEPLENLVELRKTKTKGWDDEYTRKLVLIKGKIEKIIYYYVEVFSHNSEVVKKIGRLNDDINKGDKDKYERNVDIHQGDINIKKIQSDMKEILKNVPKISDIFSK